MPGRYMGEVEVLIHSFLTSTLVVGEWLISRPDRFGPGQNPGTHCVGCRVNPRTGLDDLQMKISHSNPEPCSSTFVPCYTWKEFNIAHWFIIWTKPDPVRYSESRNYCLLAQQYATTAPSNRRLQASTDGLWHFPSLYAFSLHLLLIFSPSFSFILFSFSFWIFYYCIPLQWLIESTGTQTDNSI